MSKEVLREGTNLEVVAETPSGKKEFSGTLKVEKDGESVIVTENPNSPHYKVTTVLPPGSTVRIK